MPTYWITQQPIDNQVYSHRGWKCHRYTHREHRLSFLTSWKNAQIAPKFFLICNCLCVCVYTQWQRVSNLGIFWSNWGMWMIDRIIPSLFFSLASKWYFSILMVYIFIPIPHCSGTEIQNLYKLFSINTEVKAKERSYINKFTHDSSLDVFFFLKISDKGLPWRCWCTTIYSYTTHFIFLIKIKDIFKERKKKIMVNSCHEFRL